MTLTPRTQPSSEITPRTKPEGVVSEIWSEAYYPWGEAVLPWQNENSTVEPNAKLTPRTQPATTLTPR